MWPGIADKRTAGIVAVCHRGANRFAPENTMAAAQLCFRQGGHVLEIDVRETADGRIAVMHDETVDRTTDGSGHIARMTWDAVSKLSAGSWFGPEFAAERVLLLDDVVALCREWNRYLYIENKQVEPERLLRHVENLDFIERCFFWSGQPDLQEGMRRASPRANIKATRKHYASAATLREHLNPAIAEIDIDQFAQWAPECAALGVTPMMQYFGDDPAVFRRIVSMHPPMVNLNRVDLLVAAAAEVCHAG